MIIGAGSGGISMGVDTNKTLILRKSEEHTFTIKNIILIKPMHENYSRVISQSIF